MAKGHMSNYLQQVEERYAVKETIGSGGFAKVKLAVNRITGEKVAIKIMNKQQLGEDLHRVQLEIDALKCLSHRHICQLYEIIETSQLFCLVMEYAPGGELFDYIIARDRLKEGEAVKFFRQIVAAVAYCHSKSYIHRDLKPENLLLDENQNLKLIDFGLASKPLVISGEPYIGTEADLWSMGVLLYALLCGFLPFDDDNTVNLYRLIQIGKYTVPDRLSKESVRLIGGLLQVDPKKRYTVDDLLSYPWLCQGDRNIIQPYKSDEDLRNAEVDIDLVQQMSICYGTPLSEMLQNVNQWKFDKYTSLYFCLYKAKESGKILKLNRLSMPQERTHYNSNPHSMRRGSAPPAVHFKFNISLHHGLNMEVGSSAVRARSSSPPSGSLTKSNNKVTLGMIKSSKSMDDISTASSTETGFQVMVSKRRSRSCESSLDKKKNLAIFECQSSPSRSASPKDVGCGSRRRSSLTEFMKHLFTLARRPSQSIEAKSGPRKVNKALYNVSTTSTHSAEHVLAELQRALHIKGVQIKKSERVPNYLLRCQVTDKRGKAHIVFELEVCQLPRMELIGVRRKRLKGDTWEYKKLCEEILSIAKL